MTLAELLPKSEPRNRLAQATFREIDTTPCPDCGAIPPATGRRSLNKHDAMKNQPFSVPCPACLGRLRARRAEYDWTKDPAFGTCPKCTELLFVDASGKLAPCDACPGAPERENDVAYAKRARIPARYLDCRIGNWLPATGQPRQHVAAFTASWPPAKTSLVLEGDVGTGKTHLAIGALFDAWTRHGDRARGQFWPVHDLLERYRRSYSPDRAQETAEQIDETLSRVDLLVLDDLGAQRDTEWALERLFSLIDTRYSRRQATIVTTNVTLMQLASRVRSRLGEGVVAVLRGEDHRLS